MNNITQLTPIKASAYFSVLSFLEAEKIDPKLIESLKKFIDDNYAMSLLKSNKLQDSVSCEEILRQWRFFNGEDLELMLGNYEKMKENEAFKLNNITLMKDQVLNKIKPWFQPMRVKSQRLSLNEGKNRNTKKDRFPKELFIHGFQKLKSVFGHKSLDDEFDDYDFLTSPVYNLLFDKTGKIIITADDDGVIKLWSSENGALLSTLKSHKSLINSMDISPCNRYLASCSNDGSIRIWNFLEKKPLAVLRENIGEKLLILFFFAFEPIKSGGSAQKLLLICASEEGNIYLYDSIDFIMNNGIFIPCQKVTRLESPYMQLYDFPSSKGICSIDFHPQGFLAVGTQVGDIVIFDSVKRLRQYGGFEHSLKSVLWNDHKKTCHLTVWSKDGSKLISASFDGTAKIWLMAANLTYESDDRLKSRSSSDFTIFFDDNKTHDAKCWAVNWSCYSRYAMASFSRKSRKKNESGKLSSNIQIYDTYSKRVVQKIDSNSCPLEMNQFIYIIEPHPYKENIAFSADYDGKIVLWDIELGHILNCFQEKGTFFNCPTLELPCLDGRFSPDGYSFAVSTYYGTFSIYGYGNRDPYDYTPIEQFFRNDHKRFEFDELLRIIDSATGQEDSSSNQEGILCNILRNEYPKQPNNNMDLLNKHEYFNEKPYFKDFEEIIEMHDDTVAIYQGQGASLADYKYVTDALYKEYDHLLFFQIQNENHRSLLLKPVEEMETQRENIMEKQRKLILLSYETKLQEFHSNTKPIVQDKQQNIQKSVLLQAKKINRLRELATKSDDSMDQEPEEEGASKSKEKPQLKRLMRRSSPQRNDSILEPSSNNNFNGNIIGNGNNTNDFDDPEDENWEVESGISLNLRPKKINTRTRTSTRVSNKNTNNTLMSTLPGPYTRTLRKKVLINDDDSDYKVKGNTLCNNRNIEYSDEDEYESSEEEKSNNMKRAGLRKKATRKSYVDDAEDDEEYMEEEGGSENENKRKSRKLKNLNNIAKRKDRPDDDLDSSLLKNTRSKKIKLNSGISAEINNDSFSDEKLRKTNRILPINNRNNIRPFRQDEGVFYGKSMICARCGLDQAQRKCSSSACEKYYHDDCFVKRGLEKDDHHFYCFECWFLRKKGGFGGIDISYIEINRNWLESDEQIERHYIPQASDKVYYLFQGHEEFLMEYFELLDYSSLEIGDILPFIKYPQLQKPILCEIIEIGYIFPKIRNKKILKKNECLNVLMSIKLKIIDSDVNFSVFFCNSSNVGGFLVLKDVFEYSKELLKSLEINQNITYFKNFQELSAQIIEISPEEAAFPDSFWKVVKITSIDEDGYNLRNQMKKGVRNEATSIMVKSSSERINIWDILSYASSRGLKKADFSIFKQTIQIQRIREIISYIEEYIRRNEEITKYFINKVDFIEYPSYPSIVPFEMNLKKILTRLEKSYYRSEEALKHDLYLIKINAFEFNDPTKALVCNHITLVIENLTAWLIGELKDIKISIEFPPNNNGNSTSNNNIIINNQNIITNNNVIHISMNKVKKYVKKKDMRDSEEEEEVYEVPKHISVNSNEGKNSGNNSNVRVTRSRAMKN